MLEFRIDEERCIQCGECVVDCPAGVIFMEGYPKVIDEQRCLQCQHCLAVCPTAAVSILGRDPGASTVLAGNLPDPARLATLIKGRRAVRRYHDRDLPPELIDELLEISCHAPTGVNARSVLFTVVRERAMMHKLREHLMGRLAELKEAGSFPHGLAGNYLGWTVKAWQEEGRDILFRGAPHLLITSAPADAPCPVQDTHIGPHHLSAHRPWPRGRYGLGRYFHDGPCRLPGARRETGHSRKPHPGLCHGLWRTGGGVPPHRAAGSGPGQCGQVVTSGRPWGLAGAPG